MTDQASRTATRILQATSLRPALAVVLGSGFDSFRAAVTPALEIPYRRLPGFLRPRVEGHPGQIVIGHVQDTPVLLVCGRCHYYEGHSLEDVTFPVRVLAGCGVRAVVLTNAAGGINRSFRPGDFMGLTDHLNLMGANALRGTTGQGAAAFVDLSQTYDPGLRKLFRSAARQTGVRLHWGIYAAMAGPAYETPAEIRALAMLGADAVGMSTVPEAIVARQCGLRVAALSCITNRAAGLSERAITHEEVLARAREVQHQAALLLGRFIGLWGRENSN